MLTRVAYIQIYMYVCMCVTCMFVCMYVCMYATLVNTQCVAVCCTVTQCIAVYCNMLPVFCSVLPYIAVCCSGYPRQHCVYAWMDERMFVRTYEFTYVCVYSRVFMYARATLINISELSVFVVCCSVLQRVAVCCSLLQCIAVATLVNMMYVYMYACMYVCVYVCMYVRVCICRCGLPSSILASFQPMIVQSSTCSSAHGVRVRARTQWRLL